MDLDKLIEDHTWLIYYQLYRFSMRNDQDAESDAWLALYRAAKAYKEDSNATFATYATVAISNALRNLHRRRSTRASIASIISYDVPVGADSDEKVPMIDLLQYVDVELTHDNDLTTAPILNEERMNIISSVLEEVRESLTGMPRKIFDTWQESGYTARQAEIAKQLGTSQANVSATLSRIKHKIRCGLEDTQ